MTEEARDTKPTLPPARPSAPEAWLDWEKTPHTNSILRGPTPDVGDLPCELATDERDFTVTVSAWKLNDQQRAWIAAGAHIRLGVWQHPIPPLSMAVEAPFCATCGVEKVYVKSEEAYCCAQIDCPQRDPRFGGPQANGKTEPESADEDGRAAERRAVDEAHRDFTPGGDVPPPADAPGPSD